MAEWFNRSGLPARSLTGTNTTEEREEAIRSLRSGEIKLICTCDLFNEGVDIPEINTLLLLRPTQSPVIFQQQIGRGLRLAEGKESCLVLDFVGQHGDAFRFDTLLRTITGLSRKQLSESVEKGFGLLPTGCHIQFDRVSRDRVLTNLRKALELNAIRLRRELASWVALRAGQPVTLKGFLRDNQLEPEDLYANGHSWTSYKRDIGLPVPQSGPREDELLRKIGNVLHVNDPDCLNAWTTVLTTGEIDERRVQMLAYQMLHSREDLVGPAEFVSLIKKHPAVHAELLEVIDWLDESTVLAAMPLPEVPEDWPLNLHAYYERREIQTAVGHLTSSLRPAFREGCLVIQERKIELMFVTLDKKQGFSERVQYHDYAVSPELFHWQTQNRAGHNNATGRRYLDSRGNGWRFQLFVRENQHSPFIALGPVVMENHEGDRPISITWRLKFPMPMEIFRRLSVLRG